MLVLCLVVLAGAWYRAVATPLEHGDGDRER